MSADPIAGLVAYLAADAGVAALVGTRVFGDELPKSEAPHMPRKAVVLDPSGGNNITSGTYIEHSSQRFDALSFGETPFEANRVRLAVGLALKQLRRNVAGGVLIHWVEPAGGWLTRRHPDVRWPAAFQSFQIFFADQAIA